MRLYTSLLNVSKLDLLAQSTPLLCGFKCGNRYQTGCLTGDSNVRLHSCEKGTTCGGIDPATVVFITPVVARTDSSGSISKIVVNAGGDPIQNCKLEMNDQEPALEFLSPCFESIENEKDSARAIEFITKGLKPAAESLPLGTLKAYIDKNAISSEMLAELPSTNASRGHLEVGWERFSSTAQVLKTLTPYESKNQLPNQIVKTSLLFLGLIKTDS